MCPFSSFYAISSAHPDRKSFRRLLTAHTSLHSRRTFCLPRRLKRRNPRSSLICPKTGSTTTVRILYTARPDSVRNFQRIVCSGDASAGSGSQLAASVLPCLSRSRRHVQIDVLHRFIAYIRLAEVARVGADLLRLLIQIGHDLRKHREQLFFVVRLL